MKFISSALLAIFLTSCGNNENSNSKIHNNQASSEEKTTCSYGGEIFDVGAVIGDYRCKGPSWVPIDEIGYSEEQTGDYRCKGPNWVKVQKLAD